MLIIFPSLVIHVYYIVPVLFSFSSPLVLEYPGHSDRIPMMITCWKRAEKEMRCLMMVLHRATIHNLSRHPPQDKCGHFKLQSIKIMESDFSKCVPALGAIKRGGLVKKKSGCKSRLAVGAAWAVAGGAAWYLVLASSKLGCHGRPNLSLIHILPTTSHHYIKQQIFVLGSSFFLCSDFDYFFLVHSCESILVGD